MYRDYSPYSIFPANHMRVAAVRAALRVGVQSVKLPDMWSMERK